MSSQPASAPVCPPVIPLSNLRKYVPAQPPRLFKPNSHTLNLLYSAWNLAEMAEKEPHLERLLQGVHDFASQILWKNFGKKLGENLPDVVQETCLEILKEFEHFTGENQFTTFCFRIINNTAIDETRRRKQKKESLFDEQFAYEGVPRVKINSKKGIFVNCRGEEVKANDWNYFYADWLTQNKEKDSRLNQEKAEAVWRGLGIGVATTAAETGKLECSKENPIVNVQIGLGSGDDCDPEVARNYVSKAFKDAAENDLNTKIDLEKALNRLNLDDRRLIELRKEGLTGEELAREFNVSAKQILNRYDRVAESLYHSVFNFSVLVHTCQPDFQSVYELQPDTKYIYDGKKSFRALPKQCRCKKEVPKSEAFKLEESGAVQKIVKLKNGKTFTDEKQVWAARSVRVPRIAATNVSTFKYAAGDVQSRTNLDIAHDLSVLMLRELMTGSKEIIRHPVSGQMVGVPTALIVDQSQDSSIGRAMMIRWADERTPLNHTKAKFTPQSSERRAEYFPIQATNGTLACPKCREGSIVISVEPQSGAVKHECRGAGGRFPCTYLQIWRGKDNSLNQAIQNAQHVEGTKPFDGSDPST